ncbi:MAG: MMPL family transporter [Deltaproteobacteria bacterium]|nr:MMPL family transporter [Deltaproteobacteria bacterium]
MRFAPSLINLAVRKPKTITLTMLVMTLLLGSLISLVRIDTDPENMLSEHESVRIFHNQIKQEFDLHDVVVLGIVNETDPDGVFNPQTLKRVAQLSTFIRTLTWPDPENPEKQIGVIKRNLITPDNVDSIAQGGPGEVRFSWLMRDPPKNLQEAHEIRRLAQANPLLNGTLVSEDGRALALYIPISSKNLAYRVKKELEKKIADFNGPEAYHITGLPVAEDTFGVEMFIQMAISAPLAMLLIFLLMLFFFRRLSLILAPMIIAMVSVLCTMGLLIGSGNTLHIMSSMIPIFLMPIAVVDSVHILSEFFDHYQTNRNREKTIRQVIDKLYAPMLYTSLTSAAGFLSLAMTPIPPVQVFGLFVGFGILLAWVLTMLFIPAYVMLLKEERLAGFGQSTKAAKASLTHHFLSWMSRFTMLRAKFILCACLLLTGVAVYGVSRIKINDNPVKWFAKSHPIRVADQVLNRHFGGTYEAYLIIDPLKNTAPSPAASEIIQEVERRINTVLNGLPFAEEIGKVFHQTLTNLKTLPAGPGADRLTLLVQTLREAQEKAMDDKLYEAWEPVIGILEQMTEEKEIFKDPAVLAYIEKLQAELKKHPLVGKSNSVADVVKKVHQELLSGKAEDFRLPDSRAAVAQCLISFQNSHKPEDLWHLVTPDYQRANLWVQLHSGDNQDMEAVIDVVKRFIEDNPPPLPLDFHWAGLTYINVVWQDKMVSGMFKSLLGSFVIVLIMMVILFRSPVWGLIAMIPLSVTIAFIYGLIGLVGKDYDMPVAVLSSLTLGLAVDFAIHFLERSRMTFRQCGSWTKAAQIMFAEPARAIFRNIIVIAVGFTPLLLAPLLPYKTVGFFLAAIMLISGLATIMILPALLTLGQKFLFRNLR